MNVHVFVFSFLDPSVHQKYQLNVPLTPHSIVEHTNPRHLAGLTREGLGVVGTVRSVEKPRRSYGFPGRGIKKIVDPAQANLNGSQVTQGDGARERGDVATYTE